MCRRAAGPIGLYKYSDDPAIHMPDAPPLHPHQEPT